jgi:hypothetical protein
MDLATLAMLESNSSTEAELWITPADWTEMESASLPTPAAISPTVALVSVALAL